MCPTNSFPAYVFAPKCLPPLQTLCRMNLPATPLVSLDICALGLPRCELN